MKNEQIVDILVNCFSEKIISTEKEPNKINPCRIRIKATGKWYATPRGKTIWKRKSDASSALRCHLTPVFSNCFQGKYEDGKSYYIGLNDVKYSWDERVNAIEDAIKKIKEDIIEFIFVNEQMDIP